MKVVVDTNIFVSGILSPSGFPAQILDLLLRRKITPLISPAILREYAEVLARKEFSFNPDTVQDYLYAIGLYAQKIWGISPHPALPDPDDEVFLACALEGKANFLITGNKKHFPDHLCKPIRIVSPREFIEKFSPE